jgi:hypothetical protein
MRAEDQQARRQTTARELIHNVACQFEDPDHKLEFLHACDVAQAALVECLFKERRFYCIQNVLYAQGSPSGGDSQSGISAAWHDYQKASEEFSRARGKLKDILAQLDLALPDKEGGEGEHNAEDITASLKGQEHTGKAR